MSDRYEVPSHEDDDRIERAVDRALADGWMSMGDADAVLGFRDFLAEVAENKEAPHLVWARHYPWDYELAKRERDQRMRRAEGQANE